MRRQNHAVLNDHICRLISRIEEHRVRFGSGYVNRVAPKDSPVVRLWSIGVGNPVEFAVNEVDSAGFVARIRGIRYDDLPAPSVIFHVVGTSEPVTLTPLGSVAVTCAGIECVFGRIICHAVHMSADDWIIRIAEQRACRASACRTVVPIAWILSEGIRDFHGLALVG